MTSETISYTQSYRTFENLVPKLLKYFFKIIGPCMRDYAYISVGCVAFPVTIRKSGEAASF